MEKCILCGNKMKRRQIDYGVFFDKRSHLEFNVNIVIAEGITYVQICNSKGYYNDWHIDGSLMPVDEVASFTSELTSKLEEKISDALI